MPNFQMSAPVRKAREEQGEAGDRRALGYVSGRLLDSGIGKLQLQERRDATNKSITASVLPRRELPNWNGVQSQAFRVVALRDRVWSDQDTTTVNLDGAYQTS